MRFPVVSFVVGRANTGTIGEGDMSVLSRRDFLVTASSAALVSAPAFAAMGPNDKFDLVIKGGDVLDPSQNLPARNACSMCRASW